MPYLKDELKGFVPTEIAEGIMKETTRGSSVLRLAKIESMAREEKKFSVMTEGPGAYWVGETERINTSKAEWIFPVITAKKLGVIIPTTREKMNDSSIDVFAEMRAAIAEAFAKAIDAAALFGTNSPWVKNVVKSATDAGNIVTKGTNPTLDLDVSDLMAAIEASGRDINGFAAHYGIKNDLRKLRDANNNQLFAPGTGQNEFYNNPIEFVRNGAWDTAQAGIIAADWSKLLVGVREEIEYDILTEATLQGVAMADGKPLSLAEQDMIAIKATMRLGILPVIDDAFAILI